MMIGTGERRCSSRATSMPSIPGSPRSRTTRSGATARARSSALGPSAAVASVASAVVAVAADDVDRPAVAHRPCHHFVVLAGVIGGAGHSEHQHRRQHAGRDGGPQTPVHLALLLSFGTGTASAPNVNVEW